MIFTSGTHVAEANTPADTINSANTVSILGQHLNSWHNIEVVSALTCKHIYTEALKRNNKNIFYLVLATYKSLNLLKLSHYNHL